MNKKTFREEKTGSDNKAEAISTNTNRIRIIKLRCQAETREFGSFLSHCAEEEEEEKSRKEENFLHRFICSSKKKGNSYDKEPEPKAAVSKRRSD